MKFICHWLLISSTVTCSAYAATTSLGPKDSYDGDTNAKAFSEKETTGGADGTVYNSTGDVTINQAGKSTALTKSCFSEQDGDLTFKGNSYSLFFNNIKSTAEGAVIGSAGASKTVKLTGFSTLSFIAAPSTSGKGTMKSTDGLVFENNAKLIFNRNFSSENGGAITTKSFSLVGTTESASFLQNNSSKKGGTIYSTGNMTLSKNPGLLLFKGNTAVESGGVLSSEANITISNNTKVVFDSNTTTSATANGGAIDCSKTETNPVPVLTLTGNERLEFINNTAVANGGAIHTNKLVISSGGGGVLFANNTVSGTTEGAGGAIAIKDSGEISLTAQDGDIIFNGNTLVTTGSSGTRKRNSISLGSDAKFLNLRAAPGQAIFFYDPIADGKKKMTDVCNINAADADDSAIYSGSIVFSGEKLSQEEAALPANLASTFWKAINLRGGKLVLRKGVALDVNSFTQTKGTTLLMDSGTTMTAYEGITVNNLAINVDSLDAKKKIIFKVSGSGKKIVLSGPLILTDTSGYAYENSVLSQDQIYPSIIYLETPLMKDIDVSKFELNSVHAEPHFGYQGIWALEWQPDIPKVLTVPTGSVEASLPLLALTDDRKEPIKSAVLIWKNTGYLPNPERRGSLVPNSLWGAFVDIHGLQAVLERSANTLYQQRGFWVAGLANFLHKDKMEMRSGYRHTSAGYVLGVGTQTASEDVFQLAFCQLFGRDQDHLVGKNHADVYSGAVYYQHTGIMEDFSRFFPWNIELEAHSLVLEAQLAYSHTNNEMKTRYPEMQGSWGNDAFSVELGGRVLYFPESIAWLDNYAPYVKLQVVYAHQEDFKEQGREVRGFTNSDLFNVAVPLGLHMEKFLEDEGGSFDVMVAYVPDVIRSNPASTASLIIGGGSWQALGTNLSRQAVVFRGGGHYALGSELEMFGQCAFELRGSSRSYTIDLGGKLRF
ncbi:polymorphic outer membrane protein middle domain-containing protein [Candidatus Chlamydia sanziniae]|uniref:Outer membrane protein 5 n=1 Tax=Candidatus Chlamydia sanziniae TaxID=1806891 RepID=A0A1A9HVX1_9CHLA|nr:polymorphic outer membrane protein middle domain-containing protein [Candidatus Chlamydia sanziniae]ANH78847.1 outer membrane protein 5 [Candidatus Chlamydia sanziniae]